MQLRFAFSNDLLYISQNLLKIYKMIFTKIKRKLPLIALTVLLLQIIGLLYCGDSDCLLGEGDEICQTPLCSLLDKQDHAQQASDFNQDDSCPCTCYLSYNIPEINPFSYAFVDSYFFIESRLFLSIPANRIDHIPRA